MGGVSKKIAYVLSLKGGIPSFNYRELEAVEKAGWSISIYPTRYSPGLYTPKASWRVYEPSAPAIALSSIYWLGRSPRRFFRALREALGDHALPEFGLALQFARQMRREGVSRVHCHFADRKMFTTYFCSLLAGLPYTVTLHSHELSFYAGRKLFRKGLLGAERIVTVCDFNKKLLHELISIPDEKVETIRLTLPFDEFKTDARMKVLTVAKFHDYKGYDVLVATAGMMKDEQVVFWIVGNGPVPVAEMARDLTRDRKVVLLGSVNETILKMLYQACDVFCLPSKTAPSGQREGLPVSIIEAMAYAKPVVSTRHAGIPELVESILVPENDPNALADGLRSYLSNPELRKMDGKRNRERVVKLHGGDNARELLRLFEETN